MKTKRYNTMVVAWSVARMNTTKTCAGQQMGDCREPSPARHSPCGWMILETCLKTPVKEGKISRLVLCCSEPPKRVPTKRVPRAQALFQVPFFIFSSFRTFIIHQQFRTFFQSSFRLQPNIPYLISELTFLSFLGLCAKPDFPSFPPFAVFTSPNPEIRFFCFFTVFKGPNPEFRFFLFFCFWGLQARNSGHVWCSHVWRVPSCCHLNFNTGCFVVNLGEHQS